jgi:hypothetical protein
MSEEKIVVHGAGMTGKSDVRLEEGWASEENDLVQEQRRFMGAVQEGLADVEAGRWIADEDLDAELAVEFGWK